jgi:hypothetical protein
MIRVLGSGDGWQERAASRPRCWLKLVVVVVGKSRDLHQLRPDR